MADGFVDLFVAAFFHFVDGHDNIGKVVFVAFFERDFGVFGSLGNATFGSEYDINAAEKLFVFGIFVKGFHIIVGSDVKVFAKVGNPSGQIGAVGFFQLRLPNDEVFGLMRRKLGLLRAGVENNDADDEGEYVAEFCHS